MARAILKPEDDNKGGRGKLSQDRDGLEKSERNALAQARFVFRHEKALAQSVMNGVDVRQVMRISTAGI
ncbi:hypothetical protein [Rhizobium ruizarguesonis]|uniref:hypothetical protein n=1 Tax=Rhizobium ruizarguesonis TaxID=2081791 RepID=UPI00371C16C4